MPPPGSGQPGPGYAWQPVPTSASGQPLAEWWQRALAIVIDGVILTVPKLIIGAILVGAAATGFLAFTTFAGVAAIALTVVFVVIDIAYFALLNGNARGQTLGQILLHIAVRDATTGGPIGTQRAAVRIVVLLPTLVIGWIPLLADLALLYTIVAALSPLWDAQRRGFHDKLTNTDVVKVP